ncbi:MAG: hypothetical protein LM513_03005 [Nitrospira sp.]|nr:hypothetical protein [Nitrospira sp.]
MTTGDPPWPTNPIPIRHARPLDDLDREIATTDRLIAMARGHREGETYLGFEVP